MKKITAAIKDSTSMIKDGIQNVLAGLGTARDKRSYNEYVLSPPLVQNYLEAMYQSSWLAKKIVNAVADDMTREWRTFQFDDDETTETNGAQIAKAENEFGIRKKINSALRWSRLYGGSMIYLGMKDKAADQPLDIENIKKGDLEYLLVLDRHQITGQGNVNLDVTSPNFGKYNMYMLVTNSQDMKVANIHHSRLIRFDGQELPWNMLSRNNYWGMSELQHVYEALSDKDTTTAAIATMMFEANVDVITVPELADLLATKDGESKVISRFQTAATMKSFNRMLLLGGEETYEKKSNTFTGVAKVFEVFMQEVSGAADIPTTRLFGMSPGGLNATGESDLTNYYDMIAAKQESDLRPALEKLDAVLLRHIFGAVPEDYKFDFKPLWQMSEEQQATLEKNRADRDKIYYDMGVIGEGLIAKELKDNGTYRTMTQADVDLAQEISEAMEESRLEGIKNAAEGAEEGAEEGTDPDKKVKKEGEEDA